MSDFDRYNFPTDEQLEKSRREMPLFVAARDCDLPKLESLVSQGEYVNKQLPYSGETALHHAVKAACSAQSEGWSCVKFLLSCGANVNATCKDRDFTDGGSHLFHTTPLHIAIGKFVRPSRPRIVDLFRSADEDEWITDESDECSDSDGVDTDDQENKKPPRDPYDEDDSITDDIFEDSDSDAGDTNDQENKKLSKDPYDEDDSITDDIFEVSDSNAGETDDQDNKKLGNDQATEHKSDCSSDTDNVEFGKADDSIDDGDHVKESDQRHEEPMEEQLSMDDIIRNNTLNIVQLLIDHGAFLNKTPMDLGGGEKRVVLVDRFGHDHLPPILFSLRCKDTRLTKLLVQGGASVNLLHNGQTPIGYAVGDSDYEHALKLLLQLGANTNVNFRCENLVRAAMSRTKFALAQYLVEIGCPYDKTTLRELEFCYFLFVKDIKLSIKDLKDRQFLHRKSDLMTETEKEMLLDMDYQDSDAGEEEEEDEEFTDSDTDVNDPDENDPQNVMLSRMVNTKKYVESDNCIESKNGKADTKQPCSDEKDEEEFMSATVTPCWYPEDQSLHLRHYSLYNNVLKLRGEDTIAQSQSPENKKRKEELTELWEYMQQPKTLKTSCRIYLRQKLQIFNPRKVNSLPLPKPLKDYIMCI